MLSRLKSNLVGCEKVDGLWAAVLRMVLRLGSVKSSPCSLSDCARKVHDYMPLSL